MYKIHLKSILILSHNFVMYKSLFDTILYDLYKF